MRLDATKPRHTADIYTYVVDNYGQANQSVTFNYAKTIVCRFFGVPGDPRCVMYADEPFAKNIKVKNIRDNRGNEIMPNGDYRVSSVTPNIDVQGHLVGWRMTLVLANPITFTGPVQR